MSDKLPDHLQRLPVQPSSKVPNGEVHIGEKKYREIPMNENEDKNRGDVSYDSPRPAQE